MPRQIQVADHLDVDELERRYRAARESVARSQWQMLWLLGSGKRTGEVAEVTGYCADWIRKLVRRYNEQGSTAIGDGRHGNPGRQRLLSREQEAELEGELATAAAAGGAWNSKQVTAWMSERLGRMVRPERGYEVLRRLGYTTKTPRPRHAKADVEAQTYFKKTVA